MNIRTVTRAAAVALALAAVSLAGAPAQAQGFSFGFHIGDDGFFTRRPLRLCLLTDSQLRRAIRQQGYHDIFLNVANDNRIQARATRGSWVYLLNVSTCTGRILSRERLRRS
jgi:hypothetical protein